MKSALNKQPYTEALWRAKRGLSTTAPLTTTSPQLVKLTNLTAVTATWAVKKESEQTVLY